jgi:hypothetical protein
MLLKEKEKGNADRMKNCISGSNFVPPVNFRPVELKKKSQGKKQCIYHYYQMGKISSNNQ